ncbi:sensor histidine kinase [Spirosoma sp. KNUC1025]|uniref:sensor histidine kinase n=1 Tax=Spirosoma sp. KNUC1025 TaxID=2894082 RepID=UPI003868F81B|nr:hypothetical protein LN737_27570 [Spirosoma sp. KNUC1025]
MLSIDNGLASHEVFCGLQDAAGFLWFGTRNGLNRYDGKNCLLFTRQRNGLQDNKVVQLAKDEANRLFIAFGSAGFQLTTNGKVDVMDIQTQDVKSLTAAFPNLPFKEKDVYWLANDGSGGVIFLTAFPFRFWTYTSTRGFQLRYEMKAWNQSVNAKEYRVTGPFCAFANGRALLKLTNADPQYLITKDRVLVFRQPNVLRSLPIGFTPQNDLLLAYNTRSHPDTFAVAHVSRKAGLDTVASLNKYNLEAIRGRYWYQILLSTDGVSSLLYIGLDALYLWNRETFLKVLDKSELKGFENLFLYQLFPDNLGNLWLCTSLGVFQLRIEKNRFEPYFSLSRQNVQPNSQTRGIYTDKNGPIVANVWTHTFSQLESKTRSVADLEIKYAITKHRSAWYVGGYHLFRYDETKNSIKPYAGGVGSEIWSMFSLNDSLLLLGRTTGIHLFNNYTYHFDSLAVLTPSSPEPKFVYRFFKGKDGEVWVVAENGLYKVIANPRAVVGNGLYWTVVRIQSAVLNGLSLLDAYQDSGGVFWLATNGEGLYRWDPKTDTLRQFNITDGFPSDVLYRIEPDEFDNLWISSDYGLVRFHQKSFAVNTYTIADGITHNEFNRTSSFKAMDGRLFFGGLDGVNAFYPRDFKADTNSLQIPLQVITFSQFVSEQNKLVNKTTELINKPQITLMPGDKFFTLEFQLLDFAKDKGHRYAYRIDGIDKDWNYLRENSIRISGLPYGKFTLRIKGQNGVGAWSKWELAIPLTVLKPFYLKWWFISGVVLLLFLGIYLLIHWRIRQLAIDKRKLEQTVNQRTAQLKQAVSEQSALLLEKDVLMKEIHHRVKNNLQVISGLLELQSKSLTDEIAREALQEGQNRVRSIALIHQNLYQFDNLSTIYLSRFVKDLCNQVQSVFQIQKPVTIAIRVPDLHLDIDSAVPLGLILNELLSNSYKYAFANVETGEIRLDIEVKSEGNYALRYADNGPGLPIGFNVTSARTLGLQLVNDLSRQIGGSVHYTTQNGAVFTVQFTNRQTRKNLD